MYCGSGVAWRGPAGPRGGLRPSHESPRKAVSACASATVTSGMKGTGPEASGTCIGTWRGAHVRAPSEGPAFPQGCADAFLSFLLPFGADPIDMVDTLSPEERSRRMALIRCGDTAPEMRVRRLAHSMGYRFRLHDRRLPGKPDLVFPRLHAVVFVHGCFWHRHENCSLARMPKSRLEFWGPKLMSNRARDARKLAELKAAGWRVLVVWECQTRGKEALARKLRRFLDWGSMR